jgi:uncharacterized protein (UPF0335 family)
MSETALKKAIERELEKGGLVRKPGSSNEWIKPGPGETTISVNGGPSVPLSTVKQALDIVKGNSVAEGTVAADQLRLFIERVERLEEEKKGIADDVRDVYAEAKANGYCPKTMRLMIRLRKMETHTRQEQVAVAETYAAALGLQGVLPL